LTPRNTLTLQGHATLHKDKYQKSVQKKLDIVLKNHNLSLVFWLHALHTNYRRRRQTLKLVIFATFRHPWPWPWTGSYGILLCIAH